MKRFLLDRRCFRPHPNLSTTGGTRMNLPDAPIPHEGFFAPLLHRKRPGQIEGLLCPHSWRESDRTRQSLGHRMGCASRNVRLKRGVRHRRKYDLNRIRRQAPRSSRPHFGDRRGARWVVASHVPRNAREYWWVAIGSSAKEQTHDICRSSGDVQPNSGSVHPFPSDVLGPIVS